ADLYYRLRVLELRLPPLRERAGDILLLARHFAARTAGRYGLAVPELSEAACRALVAHPWPGNVRELKNVIERALLLGGDGDLDADALLLETASAAPVGATGLDLERTEIELIRRALTEAEGNVSAAARRLGITRMTLRYRMQKYGIAAAR
ncbi:MAG: helix-turn-helix domain-containing protein, partial [Candidatus Competibacterales bacterium]|nr:helix-turn-helix domain-containing protein [Candidatus Competibacterales bacterium]